MVYFEFNSVTSHLLQSGVCFVSSIDVEPSFILSHEPPKVFTTSSVCFVAFITEFLFSSEDTATEDVFAE